jgi:hypothetical protein
VFALVIVSTAVWWTIIAFVALVAYPAFRHVPAEQFDRYHAHHSFAISVLVVPAVLGTLIGTGWLLSQPNDRPGALIAAAVGLLGSLIVTFVAAVPAHNALGPNKASIDRLQRANAIRWGFATLQLVGVVIATS